MVKYKIFGTRFAIGFDWSCWLVGFSWYCYPPYPDLDIHFHIGPFDFMMVFQRSK